MHMSDLWKPYQRGCRLTAELAKLIDDFEQVRDLWGCEVDHSQLEIAKIAIANQLLKQMSIASEPELLPR